MPAKPECYYYYLVQYVVKDLARNISTCQRDHIPEPALAQDRIMAVPEEISDPDIYADIPEGRSGSPPKEHSPFIGFAAGICSG